jgi:ABC-2 type transport system ATP-binding protein
VAILDEPTAGMDPEARSVTRALVRSLRGDGVAVLLTTHDLADVERLADRVLVLHGGRIVAGGTPAAVAAGARPRLTIRLGAPLAAADPELPTDARLPAGIDLVPAAGDATLFHVKGAAPSPDLVEAVARWAARRGVLITELRAGTASLEERYLELTGDRDVAPTGGPS